MTPQTSPVAPDIQSETPNPTPKPPTPTRRPPKRLASTRALDSLSTISASILLSESFLSSLHSAGSETNLSYTDDRDVQLTLRPLIDSDSDSDAFVESENEEAEERQTLQEQMKLRKQIRKKIRVGMKARKTANRGKARDLPSRKQGKTQNQQTVAKVVVIE